MSETIETRSGLAALVQFVQVASQTIPKIESDILFMSVRASSAACRLRSECDSVLARIARVHQATKSAALKRLSAMDEKALGERVEETETNARLLDAVAALSESPMFWCRSDLLLRVVTLPLAFFLTSYSTSDLFAPSCGASLLWLSTWGRVWSGGDVCARTSEVCGSGTSVFTRSDAGMNQIRVLPRASSGTIAEFVQVDDVAVTVLSVTGYRVGLASCVLASTGWLIIMYAVNDAEQETVVVSVSLCGVLLWCGSVRVAWISGTHTHTFRVPAGNKYGLCVTADGYVAVSYAGDSKLRIYHIETDGSMLLLHTIGGSGAGCRQFRWPFRMCLAPPGNLLVCENGNDRVQELTPLGKVEPAFVRFIPVGGSRTVACYRDLLAVGTTKSTVELLQYDSGALIRTISSMGRCPGQIGSHCDGLCFSADGACVLVSEQKCQLSAFRVADGEFVRYVGSGLCGTGPSDVLATPCGDIIVSDYNNHRICVFNADGSLQQAWGSEGTQPGQLQFPSALALVGSKLFVLDSQSRRIQVFE